MTGRRARAALWLLLLAVVGGPGAVAASEDAERAVPKPFEALRVEAGPDATVVVPWGRRYRFAAGPLPVAVRSQGVEVLAGEPVFRLGDEVVRWGEPRLVDARPDVVRLRSVGRARGVVVRAETRVEYDGMIQVDVTCAAAESATIPSLSYEVPIARDVAQFYTRHLAYDYQAGHLDRRKLLEAAGPVTGRMTLEFVPTLALGNRRVGVEWWSETNADWTPGPPARPFRVDREGAVTWLRVTPIGAPRSLAQGELWRDRFAFFVFPARPAPERWRSVRMLPYNRVADFPDARPETRFLYLAMQSGFRPAYDGLPASVDDRAQRDLRAKLRRLGVGYMPYGMLTLAPLLHPRTMSEFPGWSAQGSWWRLGPGFRNAVIRRTHPEITAGAPYTYPVCAAREDYFAWMLDENVRAAREESLDALYFDHGIISRMCQRNPRLAGKEGRESWEYGNLRAFYKGLFERTRALRPTPLIVFHTNGAPKALGAFVDFAMFGEALNSVFGKGRPTAAYRANPDLFEPDYLALPEGYLDAHLTPPVGGVPSVLPQIRWANDPARPERSRAYQRAFLAVILSNDVHAPLWVSDFDAAREVYGALDRFGDLGRATVVPWWRDDSPVTTPPGLRATVWLRDGRALLVLANLGPAEIQGSVRIDRGRLGVADVRRVRDLERPRAEPLAASDGRFDVTVPARDLRVLTFE